MTRAVLILAACAALGGCTTVLKAKSQQTHNLVIQDALAGYQNAGAPLDRCVKAKLVAIAYEDAHEAANGKAWRAREHADCQSAVADLGISPAPQAGN